VSWLISYLRFTAWASQGLLDALESLDRYFASLTAEPPAELDEAAR
jgi:hypothetical protein